MARVGAGPASGAQRVILADTGPGVSTGLLMGATEAHIGQVGGTTPRISVSYTRASDATQYSIGDMIGDTTTAASALPLTFSVGRANAAIVSGRLTGCRCVVTPASGNLVISNLDFDLLLFRPATGIPFAAGSYPGDNAAMSISAAAMRQLVAIFRFSSGAWRNPLASVSAGSTSGYQAVPLSSARVYAPFNLSDIASATTLVGVLQAAAVWNPGAVAQQFDFALDADLD